MIDLRDAVERFGIKVYHFGILRTGMTCLLVVTLIGHKPRFTTDLALIKCLAK